jgi:2-keto-4-pentenoate hydratase
VVGPAVAPGWREVDLAAHPVQVWRAGEVAARGRARTCSAIRASRSPGSPTSSHAAGRACEAGRSDNHRHLHRALPVAPGDRVRADYGPLGAIEAALVA